MQRRNRDAPRLPRQCFFQGSDFLFSAKKLCRNVYRNVGCCSSRLYDRIDLLRPSDAHSDCRTRAFLKADCVPSVLLDVFPEYPKSAPDAFKGELYCEKVRDKRIIR